MLWIFQNLVIDKITLNIRDKIGLCGSRKREKKIEYRFRGKIHSRTFPQEDACVSTQNPTTPHRVFQT